MWNWLVMLLMLVILSCLKKYQTLHLFDANIGIFLIKIFILRRIEVPYISDINILVSNTPNPNIPNGYEKIPVDINEASLRMELRKLRNRSKNQAEETKKEEVKKDDKKKPTQL